MAVETGISPCAGKGLILQLQMLLCIIEFPRQAKITDVEDISSLPKPHQEVVWLDVAMKKAFIVDVLESRNGLIRYKENGLERETSAAISE